MQHSPLPYGARSEEEMQHNLARLGTRWQENTTPEPHGWLGLPRYPEPLTEYNQGWWDGYFWGWFWGSWK